MKSLISAIRPAYRIARVLEKGSFVRGSLFDVKRLESKAPRNRYTIIVSKKSGGGAVLRNRIKRRLKEALRLTLRERAEQLQNPEKTTTPTPTPKVDYILIGRAQALEADFNSLLKQMRSMI